MKGKGFQQKYEKRKKKIFEELEKMWLNILQAWIKNLPKSKIFAFS